MWGIIQRLEFRTQGGSSRPWFTIFIRKINGVCWRRLVELVPPGLAVPPGGMVFTIVQTEFDGRMVKEWGGEVCQTPVRRGTSLYTAPFGVAHGFQVSSDSLLKETRLVVAWHCATNASLGNGRSLRNQIQPSQSIRGHVCASCNQTEPIFISIRICVRPARFPAPIGHPLHDFLTQLCAKPGTTAVWIGSSLKHPCYPQTSWMTHNSVIHAI